jgi:hypothetical protein
METDTCPNCGAALVPGSIRCLNCHNPLPLQNVSNRIRLTSPFRQFNAADTVPINQQPVEPSGFEALSGIRRSRLADEPLPVEPEIMGADSLISDDNLSVPAAPPAMPERDEIIIPPFNLNPVNPDNVDDFPDELFRDLPEENSQQEQRPESIIPFKSVTPSLSFSEIYGKFVELADKIDKSEARSYFPGDPAQQILVLKDWKLELQRAIAFVQLCKDNAIDVEQENVIRGLLSDAIYQLDFTRPFEVKLIGHTGSGKSTLLGALLGEDVFPNGHGDAVTGTRTRVRFCDPDNPIDTERMVVYFQDGTSQTFLRDQWKSASRDYIAEPISNIFNQIRNVKYVEFFLQADGQPLLPPNTVLVDLPGGEAGEERHEMILGEELNHIDAMIYVIGNTRYSSNFASPISNQIKQKVTQGRKAEIARQMIFLVATQWDKANTDDNLERSKNGLRSQLAALPEGYEGEHQHGPERTFFYPMRAHDALFASLGMKNWRPEPEVRQEAEDYRGRMAGIYNDLRRIDPALPLEFTAQRYEDITFAQHQAMWRISGLPELVHDLQRFLMHSRHAVQLEQGHADLLDAMEIFAAFCWKKLRPEIEDEENDPRKLDQLLGKYREGSLQRYQEAISHNIDCMQEAWKESMEAFRRNIDPADTPNSLFHQALGEAYVRAIAHVRRAIQQGHFDSPSILSTERLSIEGANAQAIEPIPRTIHTKNFLQELRSYLYVALETEILAERSAAAVLAQMFLRVLARKERPGGSLNISELSFGALDRDSRIQQNYEQIKYLIEEKAKTTCRYMTASFLMNSHYSINIQQGALRHLIDFVQSNREPLPNFFAQVHPYMEEVLDEMQARIRQDSEPTIINFFIRDLRSLTEREELAGSNGFSESMRLVKVSGEFTKLLADMRMELLGRLSSEEFKNQLRTIFYGRDAEIQLWADRIRQVDALQHGDIDQKSYVA